MVGDEAGIDDLLDLESVRVDAGDLADILVRRPNLAAVGTDLYERREWRHHGNLLDDLAFGNVDDFHDRIEAVGQEGKLAVLREDHHAGAAGRLNAAGLFEGARIDDGKVVLAAHHDPGFLTVGREKAFVWITAHISDPFHLVRGRIDEGRGVRHGRDGNEGLVIRREAEAMHIDLTLVERAQHVRTRIAESDLTEQRVARRIDDRNRVAVLVRRIDAV